MIKVNIIGKKQFEKALNDLPSIVRKEVSTNIRGAADQFRELAIKDAPADTSFLRSKIVVEPQTPGQLKYEVISGSKYSAPMEFGTKSKFQPIPGIDASEFKGQPTGGDYYDFLNNILNWVKRKGIGGKYRGSIAAGNVTLSKKKQDALVEVAEAIAWSILKKGVTPHPFFFKQLPIVRKELLSNLRETLKGFS